MGRKDAGGQGGKEEVKKSRCKVSLIGECLHLDFSKECSYIYLPPESRVKFEGKLAGLLPEGLFRCIIYLK